MNGRFHIYEVKPIRHSDHIETRSLCPTCASNPSWGVQEVYERDGGIICSGCGREPKERQGYSRRVV